MQSASIINKVRMYKIKPYSVTRSSTKQQLPTLNLKSARANQLPHNKSYLKEISKQFTGNAEYDDMDNFNLTKEQRKLKQILKKMNDDTVRIIADYTPRPKKVQHHHRTATSILAVKERELENNHKIMSQCELEIQLLMEKAALLQTGNKDLYDEQIGKIAHEIFHIQEQNKILRVENERRGKSIITENRIIEEGEMRKLQTDVYLAEHRASHLRADDFRVTEQIKQYEKKIKQIGTKFTEADKYLKESEKKVKQFDSLKNNESELAHKKQIMQNIKKKNEFYNQNNQYKYLNLLRQLDASNNSTKQIQVKIDKNFVSIQASKMIIGNLQEQLQQIKAKKRQKASQINQFLNKTKQKVLNKNENSRVIVKQTRQMPSQISIDRELADNSQGDLDEALAGLISKKINEEESFKKQEIAQVKQHKSQSGNRLILQALNNVQQRQDVVLSN